MRFRSFGPGAKLTITGTVIGLADQGNEVELRLDDGTDDGLRYFLPLDTAVRIYVDEQ
jgi:hypothetical protein